jgi:hypothetical protein
LPETKDFKALLLNESLKAENKEAFWPEFLKNLVAEKN